MMILQFVKGLSIVLSLHGSYATAGRSAGRRGIGLNLAFIALILFAGCADRHASSSIPSREDVEEAFTLANQIDDRPAREMVASNPALSTVTNDKGETLLHVAAKQGRVELATALLDSGADVDAADSNGVTALHLAALNGHARMISLLLRNDASADAAISQDLHETGGWSSAESDSLLAYSPPDLARGATPLHAAIVGWHLSAAKRLIKGDAPVNAVDAEGSTPLHYAARLGLKNACALLVESGANIEAKDNEGRTALRLSAGSGWIGATRLLLQEGAKTSQRDKNGKTPLEAARLNGRARAVQLLLSHDRAE